MPPFTPIMTKAALCKVESLEAQASLTVMQRSPRSTTERSVELTDTSVVTPVALLFITAKVGFLDCRDLFIIEGDRRTSVSLFTDEVEFRRRLMTT